ncbi:MAG: hypothetical protein N3F05_02615 [Candidatus Diapherotrites archaeon]|nr:hypothetical protein [Candidatus Diapherotrites archaeon]
MLKILALCLTCFALTYLLVKAVAKHNIKVGIKGIDINKVDKPALPESTGIAMLLPIWLTAILASIGEWDFSFIAWAIMVSGFSIVGYIDDMKHKAKAKAIPWRFRAAIIAVLSLLFSFTFFGSNLLLVVLAALYLAGVASFENTFAGLNGLEAGSGLIISIFFALVLLPDKTYLSLVFLPFICSLLGFLILNRYPAKVFPGDSGTLLIGSAIAGIVVMQKSLWLMFVTFPFFLPHMIDFSLKILTNPKDPSQKKEPPYKINRDGTLGVPESRKLDFAKMVVLLVGPKKEPAIVAIMWLCVAANCAFWTIILFLLK